MEKQFRINKIYQTKSKTNPRRYIKIKGKRVYIDLPIGTPVKQVKTTLPNYAKKERLNARRLANRNQKDVHRQRKQAISITPHVQVS
jgi:hypothetical protein